MRGGSYPYMPFNQLMSFPVELELRAFPEGPRLCRRPVRELELLHDSTLSWEDQTLESGRNLPLAIDGETFDIRLTLDPGAAEAWGVFIHGTDLRYDVRDQRFTYLGQEIAIERPKGGLEVQLLVDRTSVELFAQGGKVSASFCFLPEAWEVPLEFYAVGGSLHLESLKVHRLRSAWD